MQGSYNHIQQTKNMTQYEVKLEEKLMNTTREGKLLVHPEIGLLFSDAREDLIYSINRLKNSNRKPALKQGSIFSSTHKVEIFLEPYSSEPDLILHFKDLQLATNAQGEILKILLTLPASNTSVRNEGTTTLRTTTATQQQYTPNAGVASLLKKQEERIVHDSALTSEAFKDLDLLMVNATELIKMVEQYTAIKRNNTAANEIDALDDLLSQIGILSNPVTKQASGAKYHLELSKEISLFLSQRKFFIMTLIELYALYSRARSGNFVSPDDFLGACEMLKQTSNGSFEFIEYVENNVKAIRNNQKSIDLKKIVEDYVKKNACVSALELTHLVDDLPLSFAHELLFEYERNLLLVRDYYEGNLKFFKNIFV